MDQVSIIVLGTVAVFVALLAYLFLNERAARRYALTQQRRADQQADANRILAKNQEAKAEAEQVFLQEQIARQEKIIRYMEMSLSVEETVQEKSKLSPAPEFVGYVPVARQLREVNEL